jgi:DNA-binding MarR family transcriptional regulator
MAEPEKHMQNTDSRQLILSRASQLSRLAGQVMEKKLAPLGITYQEFRIAGLLMGDNDITQKDLANKLNVRAATLSIAISKLAERGLVRRVPSTTDKRVNYLQLVPSEKIESISQILLTLEQNISRGISDGELETAGKVLSKLIENLNK